MSDKDKIEICASEIKAGHCVIMNDTDSPSAGMVAVVTRVVVGRVYGRYLAKSAYFPREVTDRISMVTPINDFGFRVYLHNDAFQCVPDRELTKRATYPDGGAREWQDRRVGSWRSASVVALALATLAPVQDCAYHG